MSIAPCPSVLAPVHRASAWAVITFTSAGKSAAETRPSQLASPAGEVGSAVRVGVGGGVTGLDVGWGDCVAVGAEVAVGATVGVSVGAGLGVGLGSRGTVCVDVGCGVFVDVSLAVGTSLGVSVGVAVAVGDGNNTLIAKVTLLSCRFASFTIWSSSAVARNRRSWESTVPGGRSIATCAELPGSSGGMSAVTNGAAPASAEYRTASVLEGAAGAPPFTTCTITRAEPSSSIDFETSVATRSVAPIVIDN